MKKKTKKKPCFFFKEYFFFLKNLNKKTKKKKPLFYFKLCQDCKLWIVGVNLSNNLLILLSACLFQCKQSTVYQVTSCVTKIAKNRENV